MIAAAAIVLGICAVSAYAALTDDTTAPVTTSDAVATYWNGATVTLSATDDSGVAYIYYKPDQSYVHLYTVGSGASEKSVVFAAPATGSADHTLKFWAQDTAGNVEAATTVTFTIKTDTTAPTTSDNAPSTWQNHAVTVTLTASDSGSGVAQTAYSTNGGTTWTTGTGVTVLAPADHSNDGRHTVRYHSVDNAGNKETAKSCTVKIDTRHPVTRAPYAASAARGHTAYLKYKVVDPRPGSPTAKVTIKIKNRAGKVVKTLTRRGKPVNRLLTARFTVPRTWKAGTYRFFVYARDQAGNRQAKVGLNKLIVK